MNTIDVLINELLEEAGRNEKQADAAYEKNDIGLSAYHRGKRDAHREIAEKIAKLITIYGHTLH